MYTKRYGFELALCERSHSDVTGPAVKFGSFGDRTGAMAGKIFINYRRDDSIGVAGRLHDRLAPVFGRENRFVDVVGVDLKACLNNQVAACQV